MPRTASNHCSVFMVWRFRKSLSDAPLVVGQNVSLTGCVPLSLTEYGKKTLELHLEQFIRLRKMLLQETRAIREISRKNHLKKPIRLPSVPGIGVTTAATLMVEIDDIVRFGNRPFYYPMCHSSGDKHYGSPPFHTSMLVGGSSLVAIRKDPGNDNGLQRISETDE